MAPRILTTMAGPISMSPVTTKPSFLFRNNRDGTFREEGLERGAALSDDGMERPVWESR